MALVAFYSVAPYERATIEAHRFDHATHALWGEPLDERSVEAARDADVLSVFIYDRVTDPILDRLPRLRLVVTRSTGFDHIDLEACRRRGVAVANVPAYGENTVAEHAFALLLAVARKLPTALRQTRELDFSLSGLMGLDLKGKTFGVVGAGRIGLSAVRIARGFGMRAIAHDVREVSELAEREGFRYVPFDELLESADAISIHAALTPHTHHLFDREAFRRIKRGAILINTARGPIVDSEALCEALHAGWLAGAGLDVFEGEELLKDEAMLLHAGLTDQQLRQLAFSHVLLRHDNVVMTPHAAFFTREGVDRLVEASLENIDVFLAGRPRNLVAPAPAATPGQASGH